MRRNRWLLPSLLFVQAIFAGTTFGTIAITLAFLICLTILAYRVRKRSGRAIERPKRRRILSPLLAWMIGLLLAATAVSCWRLTHHIGETFNPVAYFVDAFAHVCLIFGMMFYVKRPEFGHPAMLGLGLLVIMLSVASGASSQSLASQVTVALLSCIAFLYASRFILHAWYRDQRLEKMKEFGLQSLPSQTKTVSRATAKRKVGQPSGEDRLRIGWLFTAVTLSLLLMTTSVVANFTSYVLPEVQRLVHDQLKSSFDAVSNDLSLGSSHYVRGDRLGSLRRLMVADPNEIALRAQADSMPGYLRGSAFDHYMDGYWNEIYNSRAVRDERIKSFDRRRFQSRGNGTTPIVGMSESRLSRFEFINPIGRQAATVQIKNDPMKGHVFFSPLGTKWLEAKSNRIDLSSHGVIVGSINAHHPYILGVGSNPIVDPMDRQRRSLLTFIDESLKGPIAEFANGICRDQLTNVNKATAIARHFQANFEYSLQGAPVPSRDDPLLHFIKTKHPAHCELFASATVLMLRSVDVPARYVTGYVADEYSEDEESWVARNRDAHAWAEAYDDVTETWFPVESTPGRSYLTLSFAGDDQISLSESLALRDSESGDSGSLGGIVLGWLMSNRATDPLSVLIRFAQWPVFLLGIFLLWKRLRRSASDNLSADDIRSRQMLSKVDRRLSKYSLERGNGETLHQFACRLEQAIPETKSARGLSPQTLVQYSAWYRAFAEARYQGQMPKPFSPA